MLISQEHRLVSEGASGYNMRTYTGVRNCGPRVERPHIVLANGWIGNGTTGGRLARALVEAAHGELKVTTYDDPLVGSSAYGQAYKTERLARTVQAVDDPLTVLGHSRGWLSAVEAGHYLVRDGFVRALAGLTPMGHGETRQVNLNTAGRVGSEILRSPGTIGDLGSLATVSAVTARGLAHTMANPRQAVREIGNTLCMDITEHAVALSREVPTTMITGDYDSVVPTDELRTCLDNAGYAGTYATIPTTHVGALADQRHASATYAALQEVL